MKKIFVQIHDIHDPITYSVELIKQMIVIMGKLKVIFLIPKIAQGVFENIEIPFDFQVIICDELVETQDIKGVEMQDCKLQQKVLEKLGVSTSLESLMMKYCGYRNLYEKLLTEHSPVLCLSWNGQVHIDQTAFRNVVKNNKVPTLFLERGLIPKSVFFDTEGVNATASIFHWTYSDYEDDNYIDEFSLIQDYIEEHGVAVVQLEQNTETFDNSYILFPLQRDSDSNLVVNSPFYKNMYSILLDLNKLDLPIDIHYRAHPEDPKMHYTKHLVFDNDRLFDKSEIDLETHIRNSEAVITVNSTIGFSSLLKGKKVITIGNSVYSNKGFTMDYQNYGSMSKLIEAVLDFEVDNKQETMRDMFITKIITKHHMVFDENDLKHIQNKNLELFLKEQLEVRD